LATPEEIAKSRARDAACKRASRQRDKEIEREMNNSGKFRAIRPKIEIEDAEVFDPTEFLSCEINDVESRVDPTELIVCDAAADDSDSINPE